jgi:hypothetical protein
MHRLTGEEILPSSARFQQPHFHDFQSEHFRNLNFRLETNLNSGVGSEDGPSLTEPKAKAKAKLPSEPYSVLHVILRFSVFFYYFCTNNFLRLPIFLRIFLPLVEILYSLSDRKITTRPIEALEIGRDKFWQPGDLAYYYTE